MQRLYPPLLVRSAGMGLCLGHCSTFPTEICEKMLNTAKRCMVCLHFTDSSAIIEHISDERRLGKPTGSKMNKLFNVDAPFWRFVGKLADAVLLNIIWVVFSLPIVTIGASTTALYYVTMKIVRDQEGGSLLRQFWKSFKENFKQATIIWLICLVLLLFFLFDIWTYWGMNTQIGNGLAMVFVVLLVLLIMIMHYIFAVQAKFINPVFKTFRFSAILPLRYIYFTIPMLLITAAFLVGTYYWFPLILFGMGGIAFFHSFFLTKIFNKYTKEYEQEETETGSEEMPHVVLDDSHQEHVVLKQESGAEAPENK